MFKRFSAEEQSLQGKKTLLVIMIVLVATVLLTDTLPADPSDYGFFSVMPAIFLIVYIFATRRILEALVLASLFGFIMVSRPETMGNDASWMANTFENFSSAALSVMMDEDIAFLIIVCGLMGSIIALIEKAGGSYAFGEWIASKAKTKKSSLLCTWFLGVVIFIDDYMNSLTVGSCMTKLTDKHKVPREFLSYVVDSTAAPLCVIIPISTWAIFCSRILETNGWAPAGEGLRYFVKTIPYNFYGWIAAIMVPLVILGIVPIFGPMKEAFHRVAQGGPLAPPGSEKIDIRAGKDSVVPTNPKVMNMFVPIAVLIVSTVIMDCDMQKGVLTTVAFMFVFYMWQGVMTAEEFMDLVLEGLKNMLMPIMLMILAFLFAAVNDQIHFTYYVITAATEFVTPTLLPLIVFIALSITEFITGTNWGMYIIALPIVIPLAQNLGADVTLAVSAVLSAGVFGSHICFYSDATVVTSAATGCSNFDHAVTQAPYGILCAAISALLFLITGFVIN
ncbi:MAG: sodium:proton antiporter [Firmicutes bacterium]|nr:sodium:proton antiporter [Bacillota bacterium]